jgi:hypothetical protein
MGELLMSMVVTYSAEFTATIIALSYVDLPAPQNIVFIQVSPDKYANGDIVVVSDVTGTTSANGTWTLQKTGLGYNLIGSGGNAPYTGGGTVVGGGTRTLLSNETAFNFLLGFPFSCIENPSGVVKTVIPAGLSAKTFAPPINVASDPAPQTVWGVSAIDVNRGNNGLDETGVGENADTTYSRLKVLKQSDNSIKVFIPNFTQAYFGAGDPVALHNNGDEYFDTDVYNWWVQREGVWVLIWQGVPRTWALSNTGLDDVRNLVGDSTVLYCIERITDFLLHKSVDGGTTWTLAHTFVSGGEGAGLITYSSLFYDSAASKVYICYAGESKVYISSNAGVDFTPSTVDTVAPSPMLGIVSVIKTTDGNRFYLCGGTRGNSGSPDYIDQGGLIWYSTNGTTWTDTGFYTTSGLLFAISTYVFLTSVGGGIYRADQTAETFIQKSVSGCYGVALMQGSWTLSGDPIPVWVWADVGFTLYAAIADSSVILSTDYGENWTTASSSIDATEAIRGIKVHGTSITIVTNLHVKVSTDGGHTWANDMTGIGSGTIVPQSLRCFENPNGKTMFVSYIIADSEFPFTTSAAMYKKTYF